MRYPWDTTKKLIYDPNKKYDCVHCEDTRVEAVDLGVGKRPGTSACSWCMAWCQVCNAYKLKKGHQCQPLTK